MAERQAGFAQGNLLLKSNAGVTQVQVETTGPGAVKFSDGSGNDVKVTGAKSEYKFVTVNTATYSVQADDTFVQVDYTTTGTCTVTLPAATTGGGFKRVIKDTGNNAGTNNITVDTVSGTIDGDTSYTIANNKESVVVTSNGTKWIVH